MILYSRGSQGDYIALQLVENRLLLNINLGHVPGKSPMDLETSMALGSLLDDNIFHEVRKDQNEVDRAYYFDIKFLFATMLIKICGIFDHRFIFQEKDEM